jgi:hypothetical protein
MKIQGVTFTGCTFPMVLAEGIIWILDLLQVKTQDLTSMLVCGEASFWRSFFETQVSL